MGVRISKIIKGTPPYNSVRLKNIFEFFGGQIPTEFDPKPLPTLDSEIIDSDLPDVVKAMARTRNCGKKSIEAFMTSAKRCGLVCKGYKKEKKVAKEIDLFKGKLRRAMLGNVASMKAQVSSDLRKFERAHEELVRKNMLAEERNRGYELAIIRLREEIERLRRDFRLDGFGLQKPPASETQD